MHAYERSDTVSIHHPDERENRSFLTASRADCLSWTHGHGIAGDLHTACRGHGIAGDLHTACRIEMIKYTFVADKVKY